MKQAKLRWVQNPNQSNADNLNNVRREAGRHFRNKEKEYLRGKVVGLKLIIRYKISETGIGATGTLRMVTSLELI
jgi:hypothetical protein